MRIVLLLAANTLATIFGKTDAGILFSGGTILPKSKSQEFVNDDATGTRPKRLVMKDFVSKSVTWHDGVFWTFNTAAAHLEAKIFDTTIQKVFKMGVQVWTDNTCINFFEDKTAKDKVVVMKASECVSSIGRFGGDQRLCLSEVDATTLREGAAVHEIGHALGLFHTMARSDRYLYITVIFKNLLQSAMRNFNTVAWAFSTAYDLTYDYGSVMHCGERSGSANGQSTILATNHLYQKTMGSDMIAFSDILIINKRYGCDAKCNKSTSAKCVNEGFPHPRNCSIGICSSGYGGALCDKRPPGRGKDLVSAADKDKTLAYSLGTGSDLRDQFSFCNYLITAPKGKKIEVNVQRISSGHEKDGCQLGGVEVKAQQNQKMAGYRFCSEKGSNGTIVSSSNVMPVILFNRQGSMQAIFSYRYID